MPVSALIATPPGDWATQARCADRWEVMDADLKSPTEIAAAQAVCRDCPVMADCRDWALSLPPGADVAGVCGGMTPEERARMRRRNRRARNAEAAAEPPPMADTGAAGNRVQVEQQAEA